MGQPARAVGGGRGAGCGAKRRGEARPTAAERKAEAGRERCVCVWGGVVHRARAVAAAAAAASRTPARTGCTCTASASYLLSRLLLLLRRPRQQGRDLVALVRLRRGRRRGRRRWAAPGPAVRAERALGADSAFRRSVTAGSLGTRGTAAAPPRMGAPR
jgi:hypothetical protein